MTRMNKVVNVFADEHKRSLFPGTVTKQRNITKGFSN